MSGVAATEKVLKSIVPSDKKDSTKISPKDFYWDQIIFYLVSALFGLSFVDISVEFFRGSSVQCFITSDETPNRDHFAFLNNYCYGSLPNTQYYLIFVLVAALLILIPHYLWIAYFGKHFDFFFDLLKELDRLHDPSTGEYKPLNFSGIKKLEERFGQKGSNSIFRWYWMKLISQFLVGLFTILFDFLYFEDFDADFVCKISFNSTEWPYNTDIPCVYNSLRLLRLLQIAAGGIVGLVIIASLVGLIWCFGRHTNELGAKDIASFCFQSCLLPEKHNFSSYWQIFHSYQYFQYHTIIVFLNHCWLLNFPTLKVPTLKSLKLYIEKLQYPKIQNDLDFLLLRLFFADSGHGRVFRDIQIDKEFKIMVEQDQELLHLLLRTYADMLKNRIRQQQNGPQRSEDLRDCFFKAGFKIDQIDTTTDFSIYQKVKHEIGIEKRDLIVSPFRNILYGFFEYVKNNNVAVDIAFETKHGYSLVLARAFGIVTTVYFDRYFRPVEGTGNVVLQKKYAPGYDLTVFPDNIFSHEAGHITEADQTVFDLFEDEGRDLIDLIMVGPITDRPKIVSTNLLINKIYENKKIAQEATLIAVRPLLIEGESVFDHFQQFIPPKGLFIQNVDVIQDLLNKRVPIYSVNKKGSNQFERIKSLDKSKENDRIGVGIMCNNVRCIFEFCVYRYVGRKDDSYTTSVETRTPTLTDDSHISV